jgi:nitrate reductase (NAD(P)H)
MCPVTLFSLRLDLDFTLTPTHLPCPVLLLPLQLRKLGRTWSLTDLAQHKYCDDGWIAVDGRVYDITEHIATHPGWDSGCRVTEVLSIIAHLGVDCSEEFHDIHRAYPVAYKQLAAYYIGDLEP